MQPLRLKYAMFSDKNPLMRGVAPLADKARAERKTPDADNPFLRMQEQVSDMVTAWLEAVGHLRDQTAEAIFHAVYGSPWVQAWLGVTPETAGPGPSRARRPIKRRPWLRRSRNSARPWTEGGPLEAVVRARVYIAVGQHAIDARSFEVLRRTLKAHPDITLARYKAVVREQWARLVIDEQAALQALPRLLPADADARRALFEEIRAISTAAGELEGEAKRRLDEMKALFESEACTTGG